MNELKKRSIRNLKRHKTNNLKLKKAIAKNNQTSIFVIES